jgi:hypothetical protein
LFGNTLKGQRMQNKRNNENTGSRYNEARRRCVEPGKVGEKARDPERSLDAEKRELLRTAAVGKSHARGGNLAIKRK